VNLQRYHCLRCLHSWLPRMEEKPLRCPKCGSPGWQTPKSSKYSHEEVVAQWQKVMATAGLPKISYDYAKEALEKLGAQSERVPGSDDE